MFTGNIKQSFFSASLAGIAISLPLSEWLLSLFIIMLTGSWIASGGLSKIPRLFRDKKIILLFLSGFLIYMVWMINTSDISAGLDQLRLKLPLLVLPMVIGLSDPISQAENKFLISCFITGVVVSSLSGTISGYDELISGYSDPKALSPYISHIRLALMSLLAIASAGWYFIGHRTGKWHDWLFPVSALWLIFYLFLLLSLTGIVLLLVVAAISAASIFRRTENRILRIIIPAVFILLLTAAGVLITETVRSFYTGRNAYFLPPKEMTAGGRPYYHNTSLKDVENGNLVWIYVCEEELAREWNRHSRYPYSGTDAKGQTLRYTLIRYLTSLGKTKDSAGFSSMTKTDIENIENGIANKYFTVWSPWRSKLYEVVWQIDYYKKGGNPSGHSITQRLEYFAAGLRIFSRYPLFGTGTGDIKDEYHFQYNADNSVLDEQHRLLCHNQFLSFLVTFGITGFIALIIALFYPFFKMRGFRRFLPAVFFIIATLSMLWEDTLETHTGVSFFAYFYSVFIFGTENNEIEDKKS
jgi:hypothetical protein